MGEYQNFGKRRGDFTHKMSSEFFWLVLDLFVTRILDAWYSWDQFGQARVIHVGMCWTAQNKLELPQLERANVLYVALFVVIKKTQVG